MKSIKYIINQGTVKTLVAPDGLLHDTIPPALYVLNFSQTEGFYLSVTEDKFKLPNKIYGDYDSKTSKIINTYNSKTSNLGILLTGTKGSGKTMLMKCISNKMIEDGYPIIIIKTGFSGNDFINFLDKLGKCVILFDEFGKLFPTDYGRNGDDMQNGLLTLFDGTSDSDKKMLIITENNMYDINKYFLGRPGRIHYHLKYDKLPEDVIDSYVKDFDIPENIVAGIKDVYSRYSEFSFDILQNIVDEYLLYKTNVPELIKDLNIPLDDEDNIRYKLISITKIKEDDQEELVYEATKKDVYIPTQWIIRGYDIGMDECELIPGDFKNGYSMENMDDDIYDDDEDDYVKELKVVKSKDPIPAHLSESNRQINDVDKCIHSDNLRFKSTVDFKYSKDNYFLYDNGKFIFKLHRIKRASMDYGRFFKL